MKILHTADWHIGQFKGPVEDGVNLRSLDTIKCLEYMVKVAEEEKPDMVCISGDIFHQEQIGPVRYSDEMVTATRIIEELAECSKFVVVMRGTPNHDGTGQFRVLEKMLSKNKKVAVVTTPQVISTPIADVACIPGFDKQEFRSKFPGLSAEEENLTWTKYISDMVMGLRAQCSNTNIIPDMTPAILMAHYTVPGCNMESGQTSFFSNFEPVIPREAIQAADYSAVLLGHIHRPQTIEGLEDVFYSGAINAMNFNDEGQSRGFWIHEFDGRRLKSGKRYETPYRKFQTVTWAQEDVENYLCRGKEFLFTEGYPFLVSDKIVRIKYSCTVEQKKALNIPVLQSDLYEMGAFYVADIEAESMVDVANRGLLSEESDPLLNLKKWLSEKCVKDADKIVELGEPIISVAMKSETTSENHGVFRPVSISVKNYRNYKEESFDFSDISFCSINGVNGAGKSSLFMDAIADCLYEETRDQVFEMAVDDDYIRSNPTDNVLRELKKSHCFKTEKRRALTKPEQELFLNYLKNTPEAQYWYPIFAVMVGTGLRVGELTGLRWCDINLEESIIDVNHTLVYYDHRTEGSKKGCYFNVNTTKTPAGMRQVPMLEFVKEAFLMEKERQELLGLHCEATVDGYTDFVFVNRFGQPQHQATLNKAIRRIIRNCNDKQFLESENPEVLLPHFSCHSLRHTFTTRMCEAGVNVKVIQDALGHKDVSTTLNIYTDVTKELRKSEFEGLELQFNQ